MTNVNENDLDFEALTDGEAIQVTGGDYDGYYFIYTIKRGDTLTKIAHRFETTVAILARINNISNPNRIYAGHKLLIPSPHQ
ncbi:MAG: LysM domain-containing protein [Clostridia bacterium]